MTRVQRTPRTTFALRTFGMGIALAVALRTAAQDVASATKHDILSPAAPSGGSAGVGLMQLFQLVVAVAIVIGLLRFALPKMLPLISKKLNPTLGSSIKIEESAAFAGGNLYVVSVREKTVLLSVGQQGVSFLVDLTPAAPRKEEPAFFEVLDNAGVDQQTPNAPQFAVHEVQTPKRTGANAASPTHILEALARLDRIAK